DLYTLWLRSPLAVADYPTVLSEWTPAGEPRAELRLASLDLAPALVAALVRSPATRGGPRVERVPAVPGVHYVLIAPVQAGCGLVWVGVGEAGRRRCPPILSAVRSSCRLRLAAALAGFFGLPVLAFALWSFARVSNEVRDDRDLLIRQTLKDAAGAAGALSF